MGVLSLSSKQGRDPLSKQVEDGWLSAVEGAEDIYVQKREFCKKFAIPQRVLKDF